MPISCHATFFSNSPRHKRGHPELFTRHRDIKLSNSVYCSLRCRERTLNNYYGSHLYQDQLVKSCKCAGSSSKLCVFWWLTGWVLTEVQRRSPQEPRQAGRPPKIWQIFPISGSLSRTLSTPWERRPMTCTATKPRAKIKIQGHFDFDPFAQIMWGDMNHDILQMFPMRRLLTSSCYSSKRKGLNRKMGLW